MCYTFFVLKKYVHKMLGKELFFTFAAFNSILYETAYLSNRSIKPF
ncbi:hypothetical protein SAMN05444369_105142 [Capnocytophaga haemolytica]|uniref:Uncharacterized protein n=1 Tax=Capnocytophaga haemolytica TaxID=45243 RepID=A0AAX2GZF3_9FLAO|nr:hypothetical protein SAMN05444369_105142 [Capnocytophaga haemolytica]SNV12196.1 Uncharacterised protein [Capnocytophaga haemolytica]